MDTKELTKSKFRTGILICGHGSRHDSALIEFSELVKKIGQRLPGVQVEYGYLEFALPTIRQALDKLKRNSVTHVIAIPAMLFAAGHAKNDIPSILKSYSLETGLKIEYGRELGINSLMIGAAGARIKESLDLCSKFQESETLLAVVGRGSSDPDANSNVSKITRMLVECLGLGWGETLYSGITFPLVEPGLRHLVKLGYKRIVVFPYFLFSGVLVNRVLAHTLKVASEFPDIEFINAGYLSSHSLVVDTFVERIDEVINGHNLMNCSLCKYRSDLLGFESEVGTIQTSHHHHVEGLNSQCERCGDSSCKCNEGTEQLINKNSENESSNHHHKHEHTHPKYKNSEHPLGPVTLRN